MSQPMSSAGSPPWASSQSITAARPEPSTMKLPSRKSPWIRAGAGAGSGALSRSQRRPASTPGSGWPIRSISSSQSVQAASAGSPSGTVSPSIVARIDRVDLGEGRAELGRERLPGRLVLGLAQQPRRHRVAGHVLHQVAVALAEGAVGCGGEGERHRSGDAGPTGRLEQLVLDRERCEGGGAGRVAAQDPATTGAVAALIDEVDLARGPAGDPRQAQQARLDPGATQHPGDGTGIRRGRGVAGSRGVRHPRFPRRHLGRRLPPAARGRGG